MVFQSKQMISDIDVALYLTALNKAKFFNASSRLKINFTVISVFLPRFCRSFLQFCQLILQSFNFSSRSVLFKVENIIPRTKYYCSKTIFIWRYENFQIRCSSMKDMYNIYSICDLVFIRSCFLKVSISSSALQMKTINQGNTLVWKLPWLLYLFKGEVLQVCRFVVLNIV